MVLDLLDYSENSDYSNLCDKYGNIFKFFKGILPQHNIKHYIDLLYP